VLNLPDLRLGSGVVGPPPPHLWEIHDAARAFGTDADTVVGFAVRAELPWTMYETTDSAAPDYTVYTFVDRAAFVRAWMREANR
jgi:hypothetical protein